MVRVNKALSSGASSSPSRDKSHKGAEDKVQDEQEKALKKQVHSQTCSRTLRRIGLPQCAVSKRKFTQVRQTHATTLVPILRVTIGLKAILR